MIFEDEFVFELKGKKPENNNDHQILCDEIYLNDSELKSLPLKKRM
jgi:hypothetical protein